MNAIEIELLVKEAKNAVDANTSNWATRLQEHINTFSKNGKKNLESEVDLTELFDSECVCSTGQANSTPIKDTLTNTEFRKWFAVQVANLRLKEESKTLSIIEIINFYDDAIARFEKLSKNTNTKKPWLKLTRAFCTLFPKYFTTIGNVNDLKILYKAMFGNKARAKARVVEMHVRVKEKIEEILKENPADNSLDFIKHVILPWYMAEKIKTANSTSQQISESISVGNNMTKNFPLNQILYGPPGTGKTFNTINLALTIADPSFIKENKPRDVVKKRFDQLIEEGQIVFTTFHQSMSYEDFIEGIKPETLKGQGESEGTVIYEIQPGIFKKICESALTPNRQGFDNAYKKFQDALAQLNEDELFPLTTPTGKEFAISLNSNDNFYLYTGQDRNRQGTLTKGNLQKLINGKDIWWKSYYRGLLKHLEEKYGYSPNQKETAKNYVLIIDEINRGNVSQIFGELITLIEDDKRLGKSEGISITLPYSKEAFGVPLNVYIIGTMNTADRSVEALDAALRRRFSFIEMPPDPKLIRAEGKLKDGMLEVGNANRIDLALLLDTINRRIEKLLDSDHQIGHSFFLSVGSISELKHAFQNKIIPLLKEYFYGDFGKLGLVLGEGFFENIGASNNSIFARFGDFDNSDFNERVIYKLKTFSSNDESNNDFIKAIDQLLAT